MLRGDGGETEGDAGPGSCDDGIDNVGSSEGADSNDDSECDGGDDDLIGGSHDDDMFGGPGADIMLGDDGFVDHANTAARADDSAVLIGAPDEGADDMNGEAEDDKMYGQGGEDTMNGGGGGDRMNGDADDDMMNGSRGTDSMFGDGANDVMRGSRRRLYTRLIFLNGKLPSWSRRRRLHSSSSGTCLQAHPLLNIRLRTQPNERRRQDLDHLDGPIALGNSSPDVGRSHVAGR